MASGASCGPLSASTTPHWFGCGGQESVLVTQRVKTGARARFAAYPILQPVMANVLEAESAMMVRSCIPGTFDMLWKSPSYTSPEYTSSE